MDERPVVTAFLRHGGEVLLLERSEAVGSYVGRWGAVAGHAEGPPERWVRREIAEETGLEVGDITEIRAGEPFDVPDESLGVRWRVHPYLFEADSRSVTTNAEAATHDWVPPTAILDRETVPELWTSYDRVRPTVPTIEADRHHGSAWLSYRALDLLRDEAALRAHDRTADATVDGSVAAVAETLLAARPSMPALANRVNRAMADAMGIHDEATDAAGAPATAAVEEHAQTALEAAIAADREAAAVAAEYVADERVATLSRSGTVTGALAAGAPAAVLVAESRPGREGVGVAESLRASLPPAATVTLTSDANLAAAVEGWGADLGLVGTDTVQPTGAVLNKVGSRALALACAYEGIAFYAAAATDKVSAQRVHEREPRDAESLYDGDADLDVANPTFDETPANRVTAVLTEAGPLDAGELAAVAASHRRNATWRDRVVR
jgi:translation initiation factor 2B subunit (eIF-2B alpha/beta/delta family)